MSSELILHVDDQEFHLGYSRIASYQTCPRQFYYSYIEGHRSKPNVAMRRGTAYHNTLEEMLKHKMKFGSDMHPDVADRVALKHGKAEDLSQAEIYKVIDAVRFYYSEMYERHKPLAVEESFEIVRGGVKITGRIDLVETTGVITDHKFSYDTWAESRARFGVQPIIYQWAGIDYISPKYNVAYSGFSYNIIRLWPSPLMQVIHIPKIEQSHSDWWEEQVAHIASSIRSGSFPANPSDKICGFCSHKELCRPCIYDIQITKLGLQDELDED